MRESRKFCQRVPAQRLTSLIFFFVFFLVDEGKENPITTKTPFKWRFAGRLVKDQQH